MSADSLHSSINKALKCEQTLLDFQDLEAVVRGSCKDLRTRHAVNRILQLKEWHQPIYRLRGWVNNGS
jgi:hypothetical protein